MIRPIVLYGAPVLRQKASPVSPEDPELPRLIQDLWDTMYNADGVGLAAPQIGVSKKVFVVDARQLQSPEEEPFKGVFINPKILSTDPVCAPYEEGCLSIPGIRERIYRPVGVEVEYLDENLVLQRRHFTGIVARVIQHEYDHLIGQLFIDYLSPLKRQLLRRRLKEITAGQVEAPYPLQYVGRAH
ncbi:MAG: peptide deformylase [Bacteroidia bacterium]|nr:peptide deformylase [Bacteroidia bacterium]MCX7764683.1 peptide deformylase [Bacteroidia bacterium]MDW8057762.1 peptide deformylase [Bacteroidia bacterium]